MYAADTDVGCYMFYFECGNNKLWYVPAVRGWLRIAAFCSRFRGFYIANDFVYRKHIFSTRISLYVVYKFLTMCYPAGASVIVQPLYFILM